MSQVAALQQRVVQLEELFSHHEHHVQQLNGVILELRDELDALRRTYQRQQQQLESLRDQQTSALPREPGEEKPPHY